MIYRTLSRFAGRSRRRRPTPSWSFAPLERRVMLAADAGAAVDAGVASHVADANLVEQHAVEMNTTTESRAIVFVDAEVDDLDQLLEGISAGAELVLLDAGRDGLQQITETLATRNHVSSLHIVSHGESGRLRLSGELIDVDDLQRRGELIQRWGSAMSADADILLYGCHTGQAAEGLRLMTALAELTGADVAASTDLTGTAAERGDWELERTVGRIETAVVFDRATQQRYQHTLDVVVNAAGERGEEAFNLLVDGNVVGSWTASTSLQSYTYTTSASISANSVRVEFTNDLWDPANGIDRNLLVDNIDIDGSVFETEDSSVFSTGTWLPADGIVPGFGRGDVLHANGYFEYAEVGGNGSTIEINAAGARGEETMQLQIDGSVVQTYNNVNIAQQTYTYQAGSTITPDQVRVAFTNDLWDPANGIDRNLIVDNIRIDGTTYETESSDVFSTGTWLPADGITPGFGRGDTLHGNGYFQYATGGGSAGSIQLETSVIDVGEADGTATVNIIRSGGSQGVVSVDYDTVAISATDGQDYIGQSGVATFQDGETIQSVSIPILEDGDIESDEQFSFTIDNIQGGATLLVPRTATITIDDNDSVLGQGDGLLGEYFDNLNFTNRALFRTDPTIDFDWGLGSPAAGVGADTFSVRWTGQIEPRFTENYTFQTTVDNGVRLWVDNQLIIDELVDQANTVHTGSIALQSGQQYDIRMDYYENTLGAKAMLEWSSASQPLEIVPQSALYADDPPNPGNDLTAETVLGGQVEPTAIAFSPDGQNLYVAEKRGIVRAVRNDVLVNPLFVDIRDQVNGVRDRGLLDVAVHPDFVNNPYIYLLYTYDPPEVFDNIGHPLAGPDQIGNRAGRLTRFTADAATDHTTIVPNSEVILLGSNSTWANFNGFANSTNDFNEPPAGILPDGTNLQDFIVSDSESHTVGAVEFGPDGSLFVSIGDGTSYNSVDPRTVRVQDIDNLSGKVLRIDPITGQGLSDNPFYNNDPDANRSKVYYYGLRNPFRLTVDQFTGQVYAGDVGWTQWEEINVGVPGTNFGWPYYEGGDGVSLQTVGYQDLPKAQAFYNSGQPVTPGILALNHAASGINAIVLGDIYTGAQYPAEFQGDLFFNDLGQGIVRNVSFDGSGNITSVDTFTTDAQVVVQIVQGPDGNLYYVDLDDGQIGRWVFV